MKANTVNVDPPDEFQMERVPIPTGVKIIA